jgi:hypothetical protein
VGYLYVSEGELIHAAVESEEGLVAAYRILGWDGTHVEFVNTCRIRPSLHDLPLSELLLNAAMLRDQPPEDPAWPAHADPPPPAPEPPRPQDPLDSWSR